MAPFFKNSYSNILSTGSKAAIYFYILALYFETCQDHSFTLLYTFLFLSGFFLYKDHYMVWGYLE